MTPDFEDRKLQYINAKARAGLSADDHEALDRKYVDVVKALAVTDVAAVAPATIDARIVSDHDLSPKELIGAHGAVVIVLAAVPVLTKDELNQVLGPIGERMQELDVRPAEGVMAWLPLLSDDELDAAFEAMSAIVDDRAKRAASGGEGEGGEGNADVAGANGGGNPQPAAHWSKIHWKKQIALAKKLRRPEEAEPTTLDGAQAILNARTEAEITAAMQQGE